MSIPSVPSRHWSHEPWPWLLMVPPVASILGGVTMIYLAFGQPNALVVDDYARIEQITQERMTAEERAAELDLRARVAFMRTAGGRVDVLVELVGGEDFVAPPELTLRLRHAAHEAADRTLALTAPSYRGATTLAPGRYDLELGSADVDWLLTGTASATADTVELAAPRARRASE
jgi:hypothetical protein